MRNITEVACHTAVRDRSSQLDIMIIAFAPVTALFIGIRLLQKLVFSRERQLEKEDWAILLTVPFGIATVVITTVGLTSHGMGRDIWGVELSDFIVFIRYFYVVQVLYISLTALMKLTLCFFYLKVFSGRIIRRLLWGTVAFHIAFSVAFLFATIFQCAPISYQWERFKTDDNPMAVGHCTDINAGTWAHAIITVASDVWLLAIPLSQIKGLNLHWKKKIGAAIMFATGSW